MGYLFLQQLCTELRLDNICRNILYPPSGIPAVGEETGGRIRLQRNLKNPSGHEYDPAFQRQWLHSLLQTYKTDRCIALWTVTKNTIFLAFFSVILNIAVGLFLALLIANKKSPVFNYLVRLFYFFPMIVAPVYIAVIWSNILAADGGLLNYYIQKIGFDAVGWLTDRRVALKTIVGIEVWRLTGFAMLTFIAGIKNISKDYFEAASLDGAGVVQTAYYITIPQLTPTILLNLIMYVITELKTFDIPMLMTKGEPMDGTRTIAMYIYETAFQKQDMGYACAISLFFVIGIMILTCVQFITSNRWVHYD